MACPGASATTGVTTGRSFDRAQASGECEVSLCGHCYRIGGSMCLSLHSETHIIPQIHQEHLHRVESPHGSLTIAVEEVSCGDSEIVILRRSMIMSKECKAL